MLLYFVSTISLFLGLGSWIIDHPGSARRLLPVGYAYPALFLGFLTFAVAGHFAKALRNKKRKLEVSPERNPRRLIVCNDIDFFEPADITKRVQIKITDPQDRLVFRVLTASGNYSKFSLLNLLAPPIYKGFSSDGKLHFVMVRDDELTRRRTKILSDSGEVLATTEFIGNRVKVQDAQGGMLLDCGSFIENPVKQTFFGPDGVALAQMNRGTAEFAKVLFRGQSSWKLELENGIDPKIRILIYAMAARVLLPES